MRYPGSTKYTLKNVTFQIGAGASVALVGPNGSGKSTLLRVLVGALEIERGDFLIHGMAPSLCRHTVAYLSQRTQADWSFPITVYGAVMAGRYSHLGWWARPKARDRQIVTESLDHVGLASLGNRGVSTLSGGQLQRMLLARALAQEANLFLLDEPFNALDAESRTSLIQVIHHLKTEGRTFVIATHDCLDNQLAFDHLFSMNEEGVLTVSERKHPDPQTTDSEPFLQGLN
jgi:manganese/zinc/iron transport system ATP- binding protein